MLFARRAFEQRACRRGLIWAVMTHRAAFLAGIVSVIVACGASSSSSGASGSATSSGSVGGHSFAPRDAVALRLTETTHPSSNTTVTASRLSIEIADVAGVCDDYRRQAAPRGVSVLTLTLYPPSNLAPAAGTYVVNGNGSNAMVAAADFSATDMSCADVVAAAATSGTITISAANDSSISGSFDLGDFMNGAGATGTSDHLAGTFAAPACSVSISVGVDGGAAVCGN